MPKTAHIQLALYSDDPPAFGRCGVEATNFRRRQLYSYLPAEAAISYVRSVDIDHFFGVPNVNYTIQLLCKGDAGIAKNGNVRRESGNTPAYSL